MEGPSLVIATEELKPFNGRKVVRATGSAKLAFKSLTGSKFKKSGSWGKYLLLFFDDINLRIHFLMFGSYRNDKPRPNREPKLQLSIDGHELYFYSCAIRVEPKGFEKNYDYEIDLMSKRFSVPRAVANLRLKPDSQVCDVLMDQDIFAGLGNIMKNETLFRLLMHPETKLKQLSPARLRALVKEARAYALQFYTWKKANVLKRNWLIMRKKKCPRCGGKVSKRETGKLQRLSHYCPRCQIKS